MPGAGATRSAWMDGTSSIQADGPLPGDTQADVCIVGAGVAGLTAGYLLAREGRRVLIVDDGPPGMGETLRTTAHLTAALDDRIFEMERKHGAKGARLAVESTLAAIDRIERICQDERLDGVFRRVDGYLFLHPGDKRETLEKELEAAHRAGMEDVRLLEAAPLPFATGPALLFPRQGEVDAGEYLHGLADAIRRMGGRIHGGTHATELDEGPPLAVETTRGRIECEAVVACTNAPVFGKIPLNTKQEQWRTYVVAYDVPRGWIPRSLFWDTWEGDSYHYIRLCDRAEPGRELLLVGGEDHRTGDGDPEESLRRLRDWAALRFGQAEPAHAWSGQVIEPADHLPFLGRYPGKKKGVYIITSDSGQGFTNHTIGALLVTDLVMGRRNPWTQLYRPNRQAVAGIIQRVRANVEGAAEAVKDKADKADVEDESQIQRGSGAIVVRDGKPIACYREPSGELRECAAECTHMGAIVRWNTLEKTWDCPWHGSRFTAKGQVVNGPANKALDAAESSLADDPRRQRIRRRETEPQRPARKPSARKHGLAGSRPPRSRPRQTVPKQDQDAAPRVQRRE